MANTNCPDCGSGQGKPGTHESSCPRRGKRTEQESYYTALAMARILLQDKKGLTVKDVNEGVEMIYKHFGIDFHDENFRLTPFNMAALKKELAEMLVDELQRTAKRGSRRGK